MYTTPIYSTVPRQSLDRRNMRVVVAGIFGAIVVLAGAGVVIGVVRSAIHPVPATEKTTSSQNGTAPSGAGSRSTPSTSPKTGTSSQPQSATGPKSATGAAPSPSASSRVGSSTPSTSPQAGGTSAAPSYTAPPQPTSDACGPLIRKSDGSNWRCVFNDDFDGTSLNKANWAVATSPNDFFQWFECYTDRSQNVNVGNGKLYLSSLREVPQIPCGHVGGKDFSGGMVRTLNKFHLTRGKVDIRIKFPPSKSTYGVGTSLWLFHVPAPGSGSDAGAYGKWPASGEIDIAEHYAPFDDYVNPSLHYNVQSGHRLQSSCGQENYNAETTTARCLVSGATTSFHTYSVEWTTDTITMLYDGKPVFVDKWKSTQGGTAPFDQPFYLNITQGFSNLPIPGPYGAALPATAEVEYVKIWQ